MRALDGVNGTTAVHICFGYAAIIHVRPPGYSFLPELADCRCSRSRSRPRSRTSTARCWRSCRSKTIILGVIDLSDMTVETPETVAARIRRALPHVPAERIVIAPDCGMKYLPRDVAFARCRRWSRARRSCARDHLAPAELDHVQQDGAASQRHEAAAQAKAQASIGAAQPSDQQPECHAAGV